ncbi:MAG: TIGR04084 family radical SAM/SPASM domain-containing protein [Methanomicrobiales archaeon]|nr:TIGR04084 family radical SAM/SPASM domain-containing protein [Methanomicrobiales archaeon]
MHYHVLLTDRCNLNCRYCRGKILECPTGEITSTSSIDNDLPLDYSAGVSGLARFLSRDPHPVLTFYGGEPFLRSDLIREIMEAIPTAGFIVQTNGILLDHLEPSLVRRLSTILVSIDGPEEVTDRNRGAGTYRAVMKNLKAIVRGGYRGEVIARMTVSAGTDMRAAVRHLAGNDEFSFDSIHWQMDANFWPDGTWDEFAPWAVTSYNPAVSALVDDWVQVMEARGIVLRWYPFLDLVEDLLLGRASRLRCGSGYANYTVMTNGQIIPCPVMVGMRDYYLGTIADTDPTRLPEVNVGAQCSDCSIFTFCGGRCLYANVLSPWPPEARAEVCRTVFHLHATLQGALPAIQNLIVRGVIRSEDFVHEKFNGCEIIP